MSIFVSKFFNMNKILQKTGIPGEMLTACNEKLAEVSNILKPYLQAMPAADKLQMLKLGDKTLPFVQKVVEYCSTNPELVPGYLSATEMKQRFELNQDLTNLLRVLKKLGSDLEDTSMSTGNEVYQQSLVVYQSVKRAAKVGQPVAKPIFADLQKRFPGGTKRKKNKSTGSVP